MKTRKNIPNPNALSKEEMEFIQDPSSTTNIQQKIKTKVRESYKGRPISMSNTFYSQLNTYLEENPTEGNRSQFIVRVVAEYIKNRP